MSRRKQKGIATKVKRVLPDSKYNSLLITKFINHLQKQGKRSTAENVLYKALDIIKEKTSENALEIFEKACDNIRPTVEVRSRRVGGATYQVPADIRPERKQALVFRWLREYSMARKEKSMPAKLAGEIIDAYNNTGSCIKKKTDVFKMAEANKAFAHYKW
ncbi:30S ribosomal protein S7 [Candidatus Dependentiae bacterium]|nr:30S ribosomal protein S7 [Candidatus Dependentiae bacterium]